MRIPAANRKKGKSHRVLFIFIAVLFLVFIGVGIIAFGSSLNSGRQWRTNIVFNTSPPVLLSYPVNKEDKILLFILPENLSLQVPYGYGTYEIESLWGLARLENRPMLVRDSFTDLFGIPVSGMIGATRTHPVSLNPDHLTTELSQVIKLGESDSYMKLTEQLRYALDLRFLVTKRLLQYDLRSQPLYETVTLPGEAEAVLVNPNKWDSFLAQKFEEVKIREEALTVTIKNTTSVSGIGQKFARFVASIGGKILRVGNEESDINKCQLRLAEVNRTKLLVRFLMEEFGCTISDRLETDEEEVVVIIGQSFASRWAKSID